ncbi:MAG: ABC transporter permease [Bacteroidales bacterium]
MKNDLLYGLRQIRRNPALTAIIILSLALGIGANTAVFSVVNALMLRDLPVKDPGRLVAFQYREPEGEGPKSLDHTHSGRGSEDSAGRSVNLSISWPSYLYMRDRARSVALAGFVPLGMFDRPTAVVNGEPMFLDADMVTPQFFPAVGVSPALGRFVQASDEPPDAPRVGVLSYRFWNRAFGASRDALGKTIVLNGVSVTIVGVAPASFTGLELGRMPDLWIQMGPQAGLTPWGGSYTDKDPRVAYAGAEWWWLEVVGRVKPGISIEAARQELEHLFRESLRVTVDAALRDDTLPSVALTPAARGLNMVRQRLSKPLWVLSVVVGLVLLVACANVATLLLSRSHARRKEMSVRLAMGAPRRRLVRQLLTESVLYAAAGSALGFLLAVSGGRLLFALLTLGRDPVPLDVSVDPSVLGFTICVSLFTTVLFGLAPAVGATRLDVASDLKENAGTTRGESGAFRLRGGKLLVVAQIALSLPLVIGSGLFLRTLSNLQHENLGFDADNLLLFNIDPTKAGFKDARLLAAYAEIRQRIGALPGVRGVTASRLGLLTGWVNNGSISLDHEPAGLEPRKLVVHSNQVTPGFFDTMGMSVVFGRRIDERDTADSPWVAVVNETFAKRFFPGTNPIGQRFWFGRSRNGKAIEIVGVVRDAKYASLRAAAPPTAYVPYTQSRYPLSAMVFEVRTAGDPLGLAPSIRKAVAAVAPGVPLGGVKTQRQQIADSLGQETMYARLFTCFGVVALLLACVGLYGTMAYALGRRTRETGIRMALGAGRRRVLGSALLETLVIAIAGIVAGGFLAFAGARYVRSLLFDVTPLDLPTLVAAFAVMLAVALGAGYLPARRASRLDPLTALREE